MSIAKTLCGADFCLDLDLDPVAGKWEPVSVGKGGAAETYRSAGYLLELQEQSGTDRAVVVYNLRREDGGSFVVKESLLSVRSPLDDLHRIWIPHFTERHIAFMYMQTELPLPRRFMNGCGFSPTKRYPLVDTRSCADSRSPIMLAMDRRGKVTLGVGLIDQRIETLMSDRIATHSPYPDLERARIHLQFRRPIEGFVLGPLTEYRDGFFVTRGQFWYDAMDDYRRVHDQVMNRLVEPSPDPCWEPVWAPWVFRPGKWASGRFEEVDEDLLLDASRIALDLGLRTILNCECYISNTHSPTWNTDEYGEYAADPAKFPDLRGTAERLHDMGMRLCLWIDPFWVGHKSNVREKMTHLLVPGTNFLCPRNPEAQEHMAQLMARVLRDYDVDGYTVDCGGNMPLVQCTAQHEHNFSSIGVALDHCYAKMKKAMDEVRPDAIVEFSHTYTNINCLNYATAFRATDSGNTGDYELDRRLCVLLRSYIPRGKAVHFDPIWWRLDEDDQVVAKMLSTAIISGVPQLGVDLINIRESHRDLIKAWIGFYQAHKEDFRIGQMRPVQNDLEFSTVKVSSHAKEFVSYGNHPALRVPIGKEATEIYLFNCTLEDSLYTILREVEGAYTAELYDHRLLLIGESRVEARQGEMLVDLSVPQGGYVLLKRA